MGHFDFIRNRAFDDRTYAFVPQTPQAEPGKPFWEFTPMDTGAKVMENGDVRFGFYAPDAKEVSVVFGLDPEHPLPMEKGEDGIWKAVLKYDPHYCGPKAFTFQIDGGETINPYCPVYYSYGMPVNYVEIPDPNADFVLMRNVPHGSIVYDFYYSDVLEEDERCLIYLPPNYHEGGEYPVLYLQHGYGENETSWIFNGKVNHIMDNLIADGKIEPFIVVMNNGMFHGKYNVFADFQDPFERSLIECCIPHIEKKYHVIADKWHRAIAGFSMGSMQSCVIGLRHPEVFSGIGLLSGFMRRVGRPDTDLSKDLELNDHLKLMMDKEKFEQDYRLFFRGVGSLDAKFDAFQVDDEICEEQGFNQYQNYVRFVAEGYPHDWAVMRVLFHEFANRVFR